MNRIAAVLFFWFVSLPAQAGDVGTLMRLEHEWLSASANGDRAELERLLHPDFIDVTASGHIRTRAEVLDAAPLPPGVTQALQDLRVRIFGKTAVVTGVNVVRYSAKNSAMEIVFTDVYHRDGRDWRVVAAQHTARITDVDL